MTPESEHDVSAPVVNMAEDSAVAVENVTDPDKRTGSDALRSIVEWVAVIITALVAALLIKAFVFQAFEIPTGSMETTVNIGDRILVNKLSYQVGDVERGDLVVFRRLAGTPGDTEDLIKRAIGLPGETVEVREDGRIWIWGTGQSPDEAVRIEEPYLDPENNILQAPRATDSINGDFWHENCVNQPREPGRCTLDANSYFMMGDNRYGSADSRVFGPVPDENIVGRAFARIWPLTEISGL